MNEIKFRGKCAETKDWVYGSLVQLNYHNSVDYVEETQIVLSNGHVYTVDPQTVGQYTGYNDMDGKEIYAGDILNLQVKDDPPDLVEVKFGEYHDRYKHQGRYVHSIIPMYLGFYLFDPLDGFEYSFRINDFTKILGNIHDSPKF